MHKKLKANVCLCKKVSGEKMIQAYDEGAKTVNRIKYMTGAGNGACKGRRCTPKIASLIQELDEGERVELAEEI